MLDEKTIDKFHKLYVLGYTDKKIGMLTNYSSTAIRNYRNFLGLKSNLVNRREKRMQLYKQGCSDKQIAEELGIDTKSVASWRHSKKLPLNMSKEYKNYKYSEDEKKQVIDLAKNGMSIYAISKRMKSSETFVRKTLRENNIMTENQKKYYARQATKE